MITVAFDEKKEITFGRAGINLFRVNNEINQTHFFKKLEQTIEEKAVLMDTHSKRSFQDYKRVFQKANQNGSSIILIPCFSGIDDRLRSLFGMEENPFEKLARFASEYDLAILFGIKPESPWKRLRGIEWSDYVADVKSEGDAYSIMTVKNRYGRNNIGYTLKNRAE